MAGEGRRILVAAFGDPGHAFPAIALGKELAARGHAVTLQTWRRWQPDVEREGMRFEPAPEYQVFPTRERPLRPYQAAVRAAEEARPLLRELRPELVVADILTIAPALAAEIADGWLPAFFAPDHIELFRPSIEEGAGRAGRSPEELKISPTVSVSITDDIELGRNYGRPYLALYVGGMGSRKKNFYKALMERYGFADAAEEVQSLYLGGKKAEAMAALPDEMIDMVHLCGPKDRVRDRLAVYREAGVDTLIASPTGADQQERIRILRDLAELAG